MTIQSTRAIAVDSVETFHHHRALSLNKQADTIDNIRSLDLGQKGQQIIQYFQELGKDR